MIFLLGMQAMFRHAPPTYFRSITATRWPCPAKVQAAIVPPVPPPRITRSYSSGFAFHPGSVAVVFCIVLIYFPFSNPEAVVLQRQPCSRLSTDQMLRDPTEYGALIASIYSLTIDS